MAEYSLNGLKTLCEKEKLLVTSNFSFSHGVFKRLVLLTHENQGLFGKGLKDLHCRYVKPGACLGKGLTHSHTMTPFDTLWK